MQAHYRRVRNVDRDRAIIRDRQGGMTYRAIANRHGLSLGGVFHVIERARPVQSADGWSVVRTGPRYRFTGRPGAPSARVRFAIGR